MLNMGGILRLSMASGKWYQRKILGVRETENLLQKRLMSIIFHRGLLDTFS